MTQRTSSLLAAVALLFLIVSGMELPPITFEELLDFRRRVIEGGYPRFEVIMAGHMLISKGEMQGMLQVFEHRGLPGVDSTDMDDDLLDRASEMLRTVEVRTNLPAAFQTQN